MQDWFGRPIDDRGRPPRAPVPCPVCGQGFTERVEFTWHVRSRHGLDPDGKTRARSRRTDREPAVARLRRWGASLGFLPLWFVLPLNAVLVVLAWMSVSDPWFDLTSSLIVRLSLLPSILLLVARVAGRRPRL